VHSPCGVTVAIRYVPLVTAAYGTWVARPGEYDDDPHVTATAPAVGRVRLVVGDVPPRGHEPKGLAADLAGGRRFVNSPAAIHHHGVGRGQRRC
jgi:hypothetical protein